MEIFANTSLMQGLGHPRSSLSQSLEEILKLSIEALMCMEDVTLGKLKLATNAAEDRPARHVRHRTQAHPGLINSMSNATDTILLHCARVRPAFYTRLHELLLRPMDRTW